ncbi:lysozyme inhibitor LprI family protein [Salinarimonas soli]|uniref:DUF1311 domain-containing protein n=1 Tax=Salinarimonas soli TaxID=1638099 RepID=A0A5B2V9G4_9HYPH|nr:lysozyme inhibitor LprI family protein [Salinarimonas soli]KAA2235225.1 DUF1311 domain-containing protein [Salinarimonas soli]
MRRLARTGGAPVLFALVLASADAAAQAPSFDCKRASGTVERTICGSPDLARFDRELADAYRERLAAAPAGAARDSIQADQRRWVSGRALTCPGSPGAGSDAPGGETVASCLYGLYAQRLAVLNREANEAAWPKVPFRPVMVEGAGRSLCEGLFRDVVAGFFGPAERVNPLSEREVGFAPVQMNRRLDSDEAPPEMAKAELYETGRAATILRLGTRATLRAPTWQYRVYPSEETLRRALRPPPNPFAIGAERDASQPLLDPSHFAENESSLASPRPDLASSSVPVREAFRLFRDGGRTLALVPIRDGRSGYLGVYALHSPTSIERMCLFEAAPEPAAGEGLYGWGEVETLRHAANAVLPPLSCGPATDDDYTLEERAAFRPWSLRPIPVRAGAWRALATGEVQIYLRRKALTGLEASRAVEATRVVYREAEERVSRYYREAFGRNAADAAALARLYLDRMLGAYLAVDGDEAVKAFLAADFDARHAPHAAALAGRADELWTRLGRDPKAAIAAAQGDVDEPLLSLALEHPATVQGLLARGADPNAFGASGLTPLMTAARLGLTDPARMLLDGGADPDLLAKPSRFRPRILDALPCQDTGDPVADAGLTALALAEDAGSSDVADLLRPRTKAQRPER